MSVVVCRHDRGAAAAAAARGEQVMSQELARAAAELAARHSYSRLLAYLSARTRDVAAAEDALGDAFRTALTKWPATGIPDRPEAWLLTVARRALGHGARHRKVAEAAAPALLLAVEEAEQRALADDPAFPDERLKLLFVCAHPAIDETAHAPLMLQTVLGLDAARIAAAFLAAPATMSQRLVRAKAKIRDAGIAFRVPETDELGARLPPVLDAIYAAYGTGWEDAGISSGRSSDLAGEAIWLARMLVSLLPNEAEALGLLALALHCEARRRARRDADGECVPLDRQQTADWDAAMADEADGLLREAGRLSSFGRYQCEAAIQSVHAFRRWSGRTDWPALLKLYDALVTTTPSIGARVSRASVVGRVHGAGAGLTALAAVADGAQCYQPYWAVRADLLKAANRRDEASEAYSVAAGMTEDPAVRRFLAMQREATLAGRD
jgi:RNA polymerase sigma-70 factor (ECF subfamily)